ncbi:hypothetical protein J1P26_11475 [Neobacillus sp. MM2021_6]|uniref:hypothetical protein n=1 Tax=Bacillaceae TaxID=186817 RepID=UPI00140A8733|nr:MULTISPECIES: hypothetical protein [Bacillaceae]MBO0960323.1 hypothetical protein [Neobacillus sp. MM2021_6]NHC17433.1 hypothetical protein [Bacillus sp. MM2020_4]
MKKKALFRNDVSIIAANEFGKRVNSHFEVMDVMNVVTIVKWSFHKNHLGYIDDGRIVFGFKDKNMKVNYRETCGLPTKMVKTQGFG